MIKRDKSGEVQYETTPNNWILHTYSNKVFKLQ